MENERCSECNSNTFRISKTKTTMQAECVKCGTTKVFYVEQWL